MDLIHLLIFNKNTLVDHIPFPLFAQDMSNSAASTSREERQRRLLAKGNERLEKITGKPADSLTPIPITAELHEAKDAINAEPSGESGSESQSGESNGMLPSVPEPSKKVTEEDFFRRTITLIHTLMLLVLGVFSHAAFHQSCNSNCHSVLHRALTPAECRDHLLLGRMFFYGGLFSVEMPFLFLTIKSCRAIGWPVVIRIFSGFCLYYAAHIASGIMYEVLWQ